MATNGSQSKAMVQGDSVTYDEIMMGSGADAAKALSSRLIRFRKWLAEDAKAAIHPAVCVVNGEATDGTKNAPVLIIGDDSGGIPSDSGRVGVIDKEGHRLLYDRNTGCQVRAVREIKQDEVLFTIPRGAMITPDLVASSDAAQAVLACCRAEEGMGFWDVFGNTTNCEQKIAANCRLTMNSGPQLLVKILQERKKVETVVRNIDEPSNSQKLCEPGEISTRAPLLAFLIHQRFSEAHEPPVSSPLSRLEIERTSSMSPDNAFNVAKLVSCPPDSPLTFSPYARTLPSSVPLPICWKRNELALLAGCIPGFSLLLDAASSTMQLASEFIALLNAGILQRFPETFPPGLLTWERWIWAATIAASRLLPASCYLNEGESSEAFKPIDPVEFQSPPEIWSELGVMVPFLDMLNHEVESHQVTWQPCVPADGDGSDAHLPRAIAHRKIRKGSEIYTCYGNLANSNLILQYGFAQMHNLNDEVKMGWRLMDAVGDVGPPADFTSQNPDSNGSVFESEDEEATSAWWTEERLHLLKKETSIDDAFMASLKSGKKMHVCAYADGAFHPVLLTVAVVATMPKAEVKKSLTSSEATKISRAHKRILQQYLEFTFSRKLEKLLQNLSAGLQDHFSNAKLWTKPSRGGLSYVSGSDDDDAYVGWNAFFDLNAYGSSIDIDKRYYATGVDSCVLTLYDGQLRALQSSIDGVIQESAFEARPLKQLQDLGFVFDDSMDDGASLVDKEERQEPANGKVEGKSPKSRKRNRKKSAKKDNKPAALKIHIGNLAYTTTPSDLFDFFSKLYGKDNILECHIPVERSSGKSRGFGFVTMPEKVALRVIDSGKKHEFCGRTLKLAKSNSAGSSSSRRTNEALPTLPGDRCRTCGYRPRYCTCTVPSVPSPDSKFRDGMEPNGSDNGRDHRDHGRGYAEWHRDYYYEDRRYGRADNDMDYRAYDWEEERYRRRSDDREYDDRHRESSARRRRTSSPYDRSLSSGRRADEDDDSRRSRPSRKSERGDNERRRRRSRSRERSRKKKSRRRERSGSYSRSSVDSG